MEPRRFFVECGFWRKSEGRVRRCVRLLAAFRKTGCRLFAGKEKGDDQWPSPCFAGKWGREILRSIRRPVLFRGTPCRQECRAAGEVAGRGGRNSWRPFQAVDVSALCGQVQFPFPVTDEGAFRGNLVRFPDPEIGVERVYPRFKGDGKSGHFPPVMCVSSGLPSPYNT